MAAQATAGRKTKRTPDLEARLLTVLRSGNTRRSACAYVGINEKTFENWMHRFSDFYDAVIKSEQEPLIQSIGRIRQAAQGGAVVKRVTVTTAKVNGETVTTTTEEYTRPEWTADAWFAERKYAEDWGRKDVLRIEREKIVEDTRRLAEEQGLDPEEAVAAVKQYLGVR
jgi:hypothetical protein